MKNLRTVVSALILLICAKVSGQSEGELMFIGFNSEGNDGFSFVTFVDIPANTTIFFTDNEWNGSAIGGGGAFNTGEGFNSWSHTSLVEAGTVITIQNLDGTPATTASIGTAIVDGGTGMNLAGTNEVVYMYLGTDRVNPTVFLSAIANDGFGNGTITNTGLTSGTDATSITGDEDVMVYTGSTNCSSTIAACAAAIATAGNWSTQDGTGDQYNDNNFPDFPDDVPCDFFGTAMYPAVTYYSAASGDWDNENTWTLNSDGSGAPAGTGVWPRRTDNVVILSGHTVTVSAVDDNKSCGISPDDLNRSNVGTFTGSGDDMFYHVANIIIDGTLVINEEVMLEGYTQITNNGSLTVNEDIIVLGYFEINSTATFTNTDDLILSGNSVTTIDNTSTGFDDIYLDWTDAQLCGAGVMNLGNGGADPDVQLFNGASLAQICSSFTITCTSNCGAFPITPTGNFSNGNTGPGGVGQTDGTSSLDFWVKVDDLSLSGGDPVTLWPDASGNGFDAAANTPVDATNQPSFTANAVNGFGAVTFDGGDWLTLGNTPMNYIPQTDSWSFFSVFNVNNGVNGTIFSKGQSNNATRQYQYTVDANTFTSFIGGNYSLGSATVTGGWSIGSNIATTASKNTWVDEVSDVTGGGVGTGTVPTTDVMIGARRVDASTTTAGFIITGEISEIIMFGRQVNTAERIIIDNYLAAKYGVSLGANDVYDMDDNANGDYDFEVAGIGQASDGSNKRDAKGTAELRIWNPGGLGNSEFLMWGHDNSPLTPGNIVDVDGVLIVERFERIWRVSESGDVGTTSISFDLSSIPGTPVGSNLRLLIDRDGDGFADNDVTPITGTYVGSVIAFSGVNLQDGDRITLGNTDLANPLPIELVRFEADPQDGVVVVSWETASELNNAYFTIERSRDAKQFEEVGRVNGNGTTNEYHTYSLIDDGPYPGISYYRLKQTDFDETFSHSQIIYVNIGEGHSTVQVYPNPAEGYFYIRSSSSIEKNELHFYDTRRRQIPLTYSSFDQEIKIATDNLSPGLYLLKVDRGHYSKTIKIVVK